MRTKLVALTLLIAGASNAQIIAEDDFNYPVGELDTQAGGTGWSGGWTALTARTEIETPGLSGSSGPMPVGMGTASALEADGGVDVVDVISRNLSAPFNTTSQPVFYVRVLMELEQGSVEQDDFIVFWFDDDLNTTTAPNFGLKNTGTRAEMVARVAIANEATTGVQPVLGTTYLLVARFADLDAANGWETVDVWLNPDHNGGVPPMPDATSNTAQSANLTVSAVGLRTNSLEAGDRYRFGSLRIGNSWTDVVPMGVPVDLERFSVD